MKFAAWFLLFVFLIFLGLFSAVAHRPDGRLDCVVRTSSLGTISGTVQKLGGQFVLKGEKLTAIDAQCGGKNYQACVDRFPHREVLAQNVGKHAVARTCNSRIVSINLAGREYFTAR